MRRARVRRLHNVYRHTVDVNRRRQPILRIAPEAVGDCNVSLLVKARSMELWGATAAVHRLRLADELAIRRVALLQWRAFRTCIDGHR